MLSKKQPWLHDNENSWFIQTAVISESCSVLSDSSRPHGLSIPRNSPRQNFGVGSHSLFQVSSQSRDQTQVSLIAGGFFTIWATGTATRKDNKIRATTVRKLGMWLTISGSYLRKVKRLFTDRKALWTNKTSDSWITSATST